MATMRLKNIVLPAGRKTYVAVLRVPADVRAVIGQTVFSQTTEQTDPHRAAIAARPIVAAWKARIAAARKSSKAPLAERVAKLRMQFRAALRDELAEHGDYTKPDPYELLEEGIQEIAEELAPNITPAQWAKAVNDNNGDMGLAAVALVPEVDKIIHTVRDAPTPFLAHVDAWLTQLSVRTDKQRDEYGRDVKAFGADRSLEKLKAREVQDWIDARLAGGEAVATVRRRMSALRNYWQWLRDHEHVPPEGGPFDKPRYPKAERGKAQGGKRSDFTPAEVVNLHTAAIAKQDQSLADLIFLGAYTGARIEELCALEVRHVTLDADGRPAALLIEDAKTEAGRRAVPVHSAAVATVERLLGDAQGGTWLAHSGSRNKYGTRSPALSKRFTALKSAAGHGEAQVFHSLRKTVATLLQNADCPEHIAANILGHEFNTMSYGLYSSGSTLATRKRWLDTALIYPAWTGALPSPAAAPRAPRPRTKRLPRPTPAP